MSAENNSEVTAILRNEKEIAEKQEILDKLLNCHLPGWDDVKSLADVSIVRASGMRPVPCPHRSLGAMTNIIYCCHNLINDEAYSPVLVRIYGQGTFYPYSVIARL